MKYVILLVINIIIGNAVTAQSYEQEVDSLIQQINKEQTDTNKLENYIKLGYKQLYKEPLKAIETAHIALNISEKAENHLLTGEFYTLLINTHLYYGSPSDTLLNYIQLLENHILTNLGEKNLVNTYWFYALYYSNTKQEDKEIEAYIKALEIQREHFDLPSTEAGLLSNIGGCFEQQGKYTEALNYFENALELTNDNIGKGVIYQNIGEVYNSLEKYDKALEYLKLSYEYHEKGGDLKGIATAKMSEGLLYDRQQQFERSKQLYLESLQLIRDNNIGTLLPDINITLAEHFRNRKQYNSAINYAETALYEINRQQNYQNLSMVYDVLQHSYAAIGNYQKAFEIRGQQMTFKDSVSNAELLSKVETLQTEFKVEQKETENELLRTQIIADRKAIQNRDITALALLLGLLLLGTWAFLILRSNRQKQQYNEELKQLNEKLNVTNTELDNSNKELKQKSIELGRSNAELERFASVASHDLQEPLRTIGSFVGLLKEENEEQFDEESNLYMNYITDGVSRMSALIEALLTYSRVGKAAFNFKPTDLKIIIENKLQDLSVRIKEQDAQVVVNKENIPDVIDIEANQIGIVFYNLINNGIKFNKSAKPTVWIDCEERKQDYLFSIKDNGIGIDPKNHTKIFEIFKRLHRKEEFKGTGIGLASVRRIVEKHGGEIWLESELGKGTSFFFTIPKYRNT